MLDLISVPSLGAPPQRDDATPQIIPQTMPSCLSPAGRSVEPAHRSVTLSVGNLLHLTLLGVVAIVIIGGFFGSGFLLLVPPVGAGGGLEPVATASGMPGWDDTVASSAIPLPAKPAGNGAPSTREQDPVGTPPASPRATAAPDYEKGPARKSAPIVARGAPARPSAAPAPDTLAASTAKSPDYRISETDIAALLENGDARLRAGDLASARLFYERAAAAGDGRAALRLGATFDPGFLDRAGFRNVKGDAAEARRWYSRALGPGTDAPDTR